MRFLSANQVGVDGYLPTKMGSCFKPCHGWDLKVRGHYYYYYCYYYYYYITTSLFLGLLVDCLRIML
jgi:hypothetical protein